MSKTLTLEEMGRNFADHIREVTERGEHIYLKRGRRVVAEVRPRLRGTKAADLPRIFESFHHLTEEEAEAFGKDIEEARKDLNRLKVRDPWEP
ncbi:MAG: hypothetical protein FJ291_21840 [Planctomycetes bacterium]|nr:hypothetical protein [Planctomycetota bacterium]